MTPTPASDSATSKTATSEIGRPVCVAIAARQAFAATDVKLPPVRTGIGIGSGVSTQAERLPTDKQAIKIMGRII
jgi:hypothetical protein